MAKLHDSIGGCYDEMGQDAVCQAELHFRDAAELYGKSVGEEHPLYGSATHLLAKNLQKQGRGAESEPWLRASLLVESTKDGMHPTPIHEMLEELLDLKTGG